MSTNYTWYNFLNELEELRKLEENLRRLEIIKTQDGAYDKTKRRKEK